MSGKQRIVEARGPFMRTMTVEISADIMHRMGTMSIFDMVERIELLEMLRIDLERGSKMGVFLFVLAPGADMDDVEFPGMTLVKELESVGNAHTCLVRVDLPDGLQDLLASFRDSMAAEDPEVIWSRPMSMDRDGIVYTVMGKEPDLRAFLRVIGTMGEVRNVTFHRAIFSREDLLGSLTDRQRQVLIAAKREGYYDYPRRITGEELARGLGVTKATVIQHLRKAEMRIMDQVLTGYR